MVSWASAGRAIGSAVQGLYGVRPALLLPGRLDVSTAADRYRVLRAFYHNNALYDELADILKRQGIAREAIKGLRNPTFQSVEYFAAHLWPGTLPDALPIQADKKAIIKPIQQVWKWSNWTSTKQVAARHHALYGDMFIKVSSIPADKPTRVYFQMLEPEYVTDFDADERDYLTFCRLDIPRTRRKHDGTIESFTHTEVWDRNAQTFRVWEHRHGVGQSIDQLGAPTIDVPLSSFGIDFVPISHGKFQDIGEDRGNAAVMPALDVITEADRIVTRLHQQWWRHNNVTHALNGGVDASGRQLPPPRVNGANGENDSDDGLITFGDEQFIALPGNSQLTQLVPNLPYEAGLKIVQDQVRAVERQLPELLAYRLADGPDLSGRAVRLMMGPAVSRLLEARGNAEAALVRADQMALTMGQQYGLFKRNLGTFESGAFDHSFEERDVLPTDDLERGQAALASAQALAALVTAGVPPEIGVQEVYGWTADRAAQFTVERLAAIQREQAVAQEDTVDEGVTQ